MKNLEQLYKEHAQKYSEENLKMRAREDASRNIPRADLEESSPFEIELLHAFQTIASKVSGEYKASLEELDGIIKADRETAESRHYDQLNKVESIYLAKRQANETDYDLKDARTYHDGALSRFNTIYNRLGRMPVEYIPPWLYIIFALLILAGEIPLNAIVFQIFGENQVMTWIMAIIIGLAIPLSAHFIGIKVREQHDRLSWANTLKGFSVFAVSAGMLYGLSRMRQVYLGENKDIFGLTDNLVQSSFMFFWLNLAVLLTAITLAYLAHDPIPGYQRTYGDYVKARKRLADLERRRVKQLEAIDVEKAHDIDEIKLTYREAIGAVNKQKGKYDQMLKEGQEQELRCLYQLGRLVSVYRHENMSCREDKLVPKAFNKTLEFPLMLASMSEKLINEKD